MNRHRSGILWIPLLFSLFFFSCFSGDYSYYEYYSVEDVAYGWMDSLYDWDEDFFLTVYWKDARISDRVMGEETSGPDAVLAYWEKFYETRDYDDFNLPEPEITEGEDQGEAKFLFAYEGHQERLIVTRRGELWAIQEHIIEPLDANGTPASLNNSSHSEGNAAALSGKRIAVVGIDKVTEIVSEESLNALVLFVENSFVNTGKVNVVDRKSIEKIIDEYSFQSTGLTDEDTAVKIGKIAGAEMIVTGTLSSIDSDYYLQLRVVDVATAQVVASALGDAGRESDFLKMSEKAVKNLFGE